MANATRSVIIYAVGLAVVWLATVALIGAALAVGDSGYAMPLTAAELAGETQQTAKPAARAKSPEEAAAAEKSPGEPA